MTIYIDLFIFLNLIIDVTILMGTSVILKRKTSFLRITLSSLLGVFSSLLFFTNINKILLELITIFLMTIISFKFISIKYTLTNIFYLYILSLLLGGIIYLFNERVTTSIPLTYLITSIISILVIILYTKEVNKLKNTYNNSYKVDIYLDVNTHLTLIGFVDTGNNLYDQYHHRPIILIPSSYLNTSHYLLVPYHTISGEDLLKCIKPYKLLINNTLYKGKVLIGFTNNIKIDGVEVILHKDVMKGMK